MDINTLLVVTLGLIALVIFVLVRMVILEKRLKSLLSVKNSRDLEDTISVIVVIIQKMD